MIVRIKALGPLRRILGNEWTSLEIAEGARLHDVIDTLIQIHGDEARDILYDNESISGNLIFMLNMNDVNTLQGLQTKLQPNDEIIILPHVQGG